MMKLVTHIADTHRSDKIAFANSNVLFRRA